jgi:hypothetical protein
MLEVHAPHTAIHGWRDFLLHITTITIGLLIAIGLEQTVEYFHHRHLVAEARENLHSEIEANWQQLPVNLAAMQKDGERMKHNILVIRQLRDHPHTPHDALHFEVSWSGFEDAAWNTARDTGALSYMPFAEVQQLSQLYAQQQYINTRGTALFTEQALAPRAIAAEASVDDLHPAEIDDLLRSTTALSAQIGALQELMTHFESEYTEAEKLENKRP